MVILGFIGGLFVGATVGLLAAGLGQAAKEGDRQLAESLPAEPSWPGSKYGYGGPRCVR